MTKVMRKEARHTQRRDRASGVPLEILDIELDPEYSIVEIVTPTMWVGKTLIELDLRARYEITVLAIKNGKSINVTPTPNEELKEGSILVVIGQSSNISSIISENKEINRRK